MAILTDLFTKVDTFGTNFVSQTYQSISSLLTGAGGSGTNIAALLLILYIIFWGFGIWAGTAKGGPTEIAFRLLRVFAIYTLATSWGDFDVYAYKIFNALPSAIGNALLTTVSANSTGTSANLNTSDGVQNALQNMYNSAGAGFEAFTKNAGIMNPGPYFLGVVFVVVLILLIAYAVFLIILAKLFMWLLLALAPIFIISLLFGFSSHYFQGWLRTLVQYMIVQVLVYGFVAFFINISQQMFDKINQANGSFETTVTELFPVVLISAIGIMLLNQITYVASSIVGGVPMGQTSFGRFLSRGGSALSAAPNAARNWQLNRPSRGGGASINEQRQFAASARSKILSSQFEESDAYRNIEAKLIKR